MQRPGGDRQPEATPRNGQADPAGAADPDNARSILRKSSLSDAEQHVRLNAVEAVLTGTVAGPDDDNPEVRNPNLWTLAEDGYVVAANNTAVEAINDLWIVHDNDGVPVPRIGATNTRRSSWPGPTFSISTTPTIDAGLATMNELIGHTVFPYDLPNTARTCFGSAQGNADLLPGNKGGSESHSARTRVDSSSEPTKKHRVTESPRIKRRRSPKRPPTARPPARKEATYSISAPIRLPAAPFRCARVSRQFPRRSSHQEWRELTSSSPRRRSSRLHDISST